MYLRSTESFKSFENEITKINHRNWSITPVSFIL